LQIVIPAHNRYDKLKNLIDSIRETDPLNLREVIVVDDSDRKEDISSWSIGLDIRIISVDHRIYISQAKNKGLEVSSSELIYFIDDDNQVDKSTFELPIKILKEDNDVGTVCPSVLYNQDRRLVWVYAHPFRRDRWGHELIGRNKMRDSTRETRSLILTPF